jgi:UDP-galactopyranose mutase
MFEGVRFDPRGSGGAPPAIICLSHLRWDSVFQRPHHLMTRFGRERHVFFVEEPRCDGHERVDVREVAPGVTVVVAHVRSDADARGLAAAQRAAVDEAVGLLGSDRFALWFYTPMAVAWTRHLRPAAVVYDCMDELSAFADAPVTVTDREGELLDSADLVFAGGQSLFERKRGRHPHVFLFPSGVDREHFARARLAGADPSDQAQIAHPRIGFFGVLDERLDTTLLAGVASIRPQYGFVLLGPITKIDERSLPSAPNIHHLGQKRYDDLPDYIRGWDVAMLPFANNEATRFISPTKTPEYLAAGKPVISTPIRDVVRPYGHRGYAVIADGVDEFARGIDALLDEPVLPLDEIDAFLDTQSWGQTWERMRDLLDEASRKGDRYTDRVVELRDVDPPDGGRIPVAATDTHTDVVVGPSRSFDHLIVGAGFAGAVLAERLATQEGERVLVVDRRSHIGGNAYDEYDADGILIHRYGPHIFHTNSARVFEYLSAFTRWRPYEHRVLASVDGQLVPVPINVETINTLYGLQLTRFDVEAFLASVREPIDQPATSEDVVVSAVGRELYEKLFRNYTRKQWGLDPSELDASVTSRVATRHDFDPRYFTDRFQSMPVEGYTRMFSRMLDHPNIKVMLNTDYREIVDMIPFGEMIYTGPIDGFFDHRFGTLPYRSIEFEFQTLAEEQHQPAAVINHPNDHDYTRVTEFKYLTGQRHEKTSIAYEYPRAEGDPYYPVPRPESAEIYKRYRALAERTPGVHFVGRLATYKYYNMDQVVAQALAVFERLRRSSRGGEEAADGVDGAIVSPTRGVGWDRVHAQPGRRSLVRPA